MSTFFCDEQLALLPFSHLSVPFFHCVFLFALLNYLQGVLITSHTEEPEAYLGQTCLPSLNCVRNTQLSSFMLRALRHLHSVDCRFHPGDQSGSGVRKRETTCRVVWAIGHCGPGLTLVPRSSSDLRRAPWHQAHAYGKTLVPSLSVKDAERHRKLHRRVRSALP